MTIFFFLLSLAIKFRIFASVFFVLVHVFKIIISAFLFSFTIEETLDDPNFVSDFYNYASKLNLSDRQKKDLENELSKKMDWKESSESNSFGDRLSFFFL